MRLDPSCDIYTPTRTASPASSDAQPAADASILLEDEGASGHGLDALDLLHGRDPQASLGADVDAPAAEDAQVRIQPDVEEALEASGRLQPRLFLGVPELDLRRPDPQLRRHRRYLLSRDRVVVR